MWMRLCAVCKTLLQKSRLATRSAASAVGRGSPRIAGQERKIKDDARPRQRRVLFCLLSWKKISSHPKAKSAAIASCLVRTVTTSGQ